MELLPRADRLLVLGYGWRDSHVNTWVREYADLHRDRKTAIVTRRTGTDVGETTPEVDALIHLIGSRWLGIDSLLFLPTAPRHFHADKTFAIAADGFVMRDGDERELLEFITT
jgi:hypothetical protein